MLHGVAAGAWKSLEMPWFPRNIPQREMRADLSADTTSSH
jgi:hypothetical protein